MLTSFFSKARPKQADEEPEEAQMEGSRRIGRRFEVRRYNGVITEDGLSHHFRLKDLSCGGVSGITAAPIEDGQIVPVELVKGVPMRATVRWTRGTSVGLSFRQPLPMYLVSAILEADRRHRPPAKVEDLGPLTTLELSDVACPIEEAEEHGGDEADPSGEETERRAEARIRVLLLIGRIASGNDEGFCCVRSLSDSGLMAETSLVLKVGDDVEVELSARHHLAGRVAWKDKAGIGMVLSQSIDSVLLLSQLAKGETEPVQPPVEEETSDGG
ncbi:MAG TPA: PilZ domain-containing protein [Allosphingosinicella sp.]